MVVVILVFFPQQCLSIINLNLSFLSKILFCLESYMLTVSPIISNIKKVYSLHFQLIKKYEISYLSLILILVGLVLIFAGREREHWAVYYTSP